jgi:antitoxin component of MazEF toxin-antitoxin module
MYNLTMQEKLKKPVEVPEEQKRDFGKEKMHLVGEIEPLMLGESKGKKGVNIMEVWESRRKCSCEGIGLTSAVTVDVFRHAGTVEKFIISEVRDGNLLESRFNSLLGPVAGGTSPASLVEEHRKNLEGFMNGEFFKHAMRISEDYTVGVNDNIRSKSINLPTKLVSEMHLADKMSCKLEEGRDSEGDYLLMTPLKTTAIQRKVQKSGGSLQVAISEDMLAVSGLRLGDYVKVDREGNLFSLRKTEASNPNAMKVHKVSDSIGVTIPNADAEKLKVEKGMFGIWTFDKDDEGKPRLWLELSRENPHISAIYTSNRGYTKYKKAGVNQFHAAIPQEMCEWLNGGDEAILQPKDDRLYIRKKQDMVI